jgi:anti-sigma factor RsiW
MHAVVMESLEEYLSGALEPVDRQRIEAHLSKCKMCSAEIAAMEDVSLLFEGLRGGEALDPAPGFYARVKDRVGERKPSFSLADLFALNLVIGRRLAFACLLTLAVLGSYLVWRETGYAGSLSPEAVIGQQDLPAFHSAPGPDAMLVTLTAYEH